MKYVITIVAGLIVLALIGAAAGGSESTSTPQAAAAKTSELKADKPKQNPDLKAYQEKHETQQKTWDKIEEELVAEAEAKKAEPSVTTAQQNAIESAESYLDYGGFSRSGLIDQLKFEDYSVADATYAVENVSVNWNDEAVESAQSYLDSGSFSRSGLLEQLEFEGYTPAQAAHGVDAAY